MRKSVILALSLISFSHLASADNGSPGAKALFYGMNDMPQLATTEKTSLPTTQTVSPTTQNAQKVAQHSAQAAPHKVISKHHKPTNLGIKSWIEVVDDNGHVQQIQTPSHTFKSGDAVRLGIQTNMTGYLYVVNAGSSGNMHLLYPVDGRPAKVKAGVSYTVPGKGLIRFDSTPGNEEVLILVSPQPLADMPQAKPFNPSTASAETWNKVALNTGSKDLFYEDTSNPVKPAVYSVSSVPVSMTAKAVTLRLTLSHQ
ncbi:hypothetical protein THUN1379_24730 [Paludibacterium sp. THUN1379]|uniref:DUF4384 domain-containing protein n=1 Tax=Paludibacterium sp. THUN1379 TaxID=3112107 RepID=UPI0030933936|nr:hypothetical protein THUN1379_24730 [Paludibacterium sp. THUN1379]